MGISPTDLSNDFVESGMRLITQSSSDSLLKLSKEQRREECSVDLWDPTTGPQEPSEDCANL